MKGQLTSEHRRLIVPDKQMLRLWNPLWNPLYATDLIPPQNYENCYRKSFENYVAPEILIPILRGK